MFCTAFTVMFMGRETFRFNSMALCGCSRPLPLAQSSMCSTKTLRLAQLREHVRRKEHGAPDYYISWQYRGFQQRSGDVLKRYAGTRTTKNAHISTKLDESLRNRRKILDAFLFAPPTTATACSRQISWELALPSSHFPAEGAIRHQRMPQPPPGGCGSALPRAT
jgi:hypothetical protein